MYTFVTSLNKAYWNSTSKININSWVECLPEDVNIVTIAQLPFACLVYFGCYALINIGYHMIVLEDCKDAQDELLDEIK